MKTKVNIEEVCKAYNLAREKNAGRKGGPKWVSEVLRNEGLSGNMIKRILRETTLLTPFKRENVGKGNYKGYIFPYSPINIKWFENWLNNKKETLPIKKDENFERECAAYLKQQGYQLKKCIGFDEDAFQKDYPDLYQKYLVYEKI